MQEAGINPAIEYMRLHDMFYKFSYASNDSVTLHDACNDSFWNMPFRETCISLGDYDDFYGFWFENNPQYLDFNELLLFCEYSYNLLRYAENTRNGIYVEEPRRIYFDQLFKVVDKIGYTFVQSSGDVSILIPKDAAVISVAEVTDTSTANMVLEYNHHALKGNLTKKKTILKFLADDMEPQKKILASINNTLCNNLFQMFHKFIRHNNDDNPVISVMTKDEIETCYDDMYQMWLLAKLEIDNVERKQRVSAILQQINS